MKYSDPRIEIIVFSSEEVLTASAIKDFVFEDIGSKAGNVSMYTNTIRYDVDMGA